MSEASQVPRRTTVRIMAVTFVVLFCLLVWRVWEACFADRPSPFIDLAYYRSALAAVAAGRPLFDVLGYPPFTLLPLTPLGVLPEHLGNVLWTASTLLLAVGLVALLKWLAVRAGRDDLAETGSAGRVATTAFAASLLVMSEPMVNHLQVGQISLIVLALVFVDASGILPGKAQGVLTGLAAALKLTPLIMLPYYVVTGQRRQAVVATLTFGAATGIGFAVFPADSVAFWSRLGSTGRFGDLARPDNLSILGTLSRWLPLWDAQRALWFGLALVVGAIALLRARGHFQREQYVEAALVMGAASVALSPVSWPHHQVWLVLIAFWLFWSPMARERLLGFLVYLPYALPYVAVLITSRPDAHLAIRWAAEVPAIVPVLIALLGLPSAGLAPRVGSTKPAATRESEGEVSPLRH